MPRWVILAVIILASLVLIPFAFIARSRVTRSPQPRIHLIPDMDNQPRFKSQQGNDLFADGRAMRPPVEGTVARGRLNEDDAFIRGIGDGDWSTELPVELDAALLERGRERYGAFCAPCHGLAGYGDGIVSKRAEGLQEGTWIPPSSLHTELVRSRPVGHLYNSITHGIRTMPAYGSQIPESDRWAIVGYVRALQRSQNGRLEDVPEDLRSNLR
jgi:mono/diheme cytochrome c family protein